MNCYASGTKPCLVGRGEERQKINPLIALQSQLLHLELQLSNPLVRRFQLVAQILYFILLVLNHFLELCGEKFLLLTETQCIGWSR